MPPTDTFRDRYYREYDLKGRVRLSILLSMIFYPAFLLLDALYPDFGPATAAGGEPEIPFLTFALIRGVVVAINGALLLVHRHVNTVRALLNLGMTLLFVDTIGIAIMVQLLGGFESSYYQGFTLVIMCMVVLLPFALRESLIVSVVVWISYVAPSLIRIAQESLDWRVIVHNLFFLTSILIIAVVASFLMDAIRVRALNHLIRFEQSNIQLKQLGERKDQFFANVNHELRTPLTLILAPLGSLIDGQLGNLSVEHKETLVTIRRNGFKLLKLINDLLDLAKFEEGKMRLRRQTLDFVAYLAQQIALVKPLADSKKQDLRFQPPAQPVVLTIDPDHFEKVVSNLLSNAIKFTPEGGCITVSLEPRPAAVVLQVTDTGIGIPSDMLEAIFSRFYQVDHSLARAQGGTGIGLSLARRLVELHGGRIWAESECGKGSRFFVELANEDPQALQASANADIRSSEVSAVQRVDLLPTPPPPDTQGHKGRHEHHLVVIDDCPEMLTLLHRLLRDEFDLDCVTSGEAGLALIGERQADLVLCDVMMPVMDGLTLCRKLKADETTKHIPVILVTARSGAEALDEGLAAGADDYLAKPFDAIELKARIRSLLRMRRAEADLALAHHNLKTRAADLVERHRALFLAMIRSLVSALEAKDKYTRDHSNRVAAFSQAVAQSMGLDEHERADLEMAALLHDVGKIAIPERILNKPGRLTAEEYAQIQHHTVSGENILKPVVQLQQIAQIVRHHHERYDGHGYPDGLKGQAIPLGARIITVADTYDAITSSRPFREAQSHTHAIKEIVKNSGLQFDPEVVEHFLKASKEWIPERDAWTVESADRPSRSDAPP